MEQLRGSITAGPINSPTVLEQYHDQMEPLVSQLERVDGDLKNLELPLATSRDTACQPTSNKSAVKLSQKGN